MTLEDTPRNDDLSDIVQMVTEGFLQLGSRPLAQAPTPPANVWTGSIAVSGGFDGGIVLTCTPELVRHAAEAILEKLPGQQATDEQARDFLAELTNIVGGHVKALLSSKVSEHCTLSLPTVTSGAVALSERRIINDLWCTCAGTPMHVQVYEGAEASKRGSDA
jgi:CheY-specific phosphatase CheX